MDWDIRNNLRLRHDISFPFTHIQPLCFPLAFREFLIQCLSTLWKTIEFLALFQVKKMNVGEAFVNLGKRFQLMRAKTNVNI